jgi:hypothetical protein
MISTSTHNSRDYEETLRRLPFKALKNDTVEGLFFNLAKHISTHSDDELKCRESDVQEVPCSQEGAWDQPSENRLHPVQE